MSAKERKWSENYVQYDFTCVTKSDGTHRPQCMLCNNKLSNSGLAPAKLRKHFAKVHGIGKYVGTTHDQFKQKRARFNANASITSYGFVPVDKPIFTASYEVDYLIGKHGKPHTMAKLLLSQLHCEWLTLCLEQQLKTSSFWCHSQMTLLKTDILHQVVADLSQLIAFVFYVKGDKIKEEFLFKHLTTTAKAINVKKILDDFFTNSSLTWSMVSAVCTNGAPTMMGCSSGLRGLIKGDAPHITITHCMLHRHALVSKTLPSITC